MIQFKEGMFKVIEGKYTGRIGKIEANLKGEKIGNCMFYPVEGVHPYRVCLSLDSIKRIS